MLKGRGGVCWDGGGGVGRVGRGGRGGWGGVVTVRDSTTKCQQSRNQKSAAAVLMLLAKFGPGLHAKMKVNEGIWVICTAESMGID